MISHKTKRRDAAAFALLALVSLPLTGGCRQQNDAPTPAKMATAPQSQNDAWLAAVKQGDMGKVKTLLDSGANCETRNPADGRTALMLAAVQRRAPLVELLIQRGAKIEAQDDDGVTALMWAAFSGSVDSVRALRKAGANVSAKDKFGKAAQDWGKNHAEIVAALKINTVSGELSARHFTRHSTSIIHNKNQ